MPIKSQYGYLFTSGNSSVAAKTLAHELGHGFFEFSHTFDEEIGLEKNSTNNLMDYKADGTHLVKQQWDEIYDPQKKLFTWAQGDGDGEFLYGITWLGNYFWGLAPDEQESQIETDRSLFKHVYENYVKYFNDSKSKDVNLSIEEYKNWTVRKASHQGIAKKVFDGVKDENTTFSLHNEGIYFEEYTLEEKPYKVAVYSNKEAINLLQDIRIRSFKSLRYNESIKVGYTNDYGLITFYDTDGKVQMTLQIIGGNSPKKDVTQWVNYLGLLLPSEEQRKEDVDVSITEILSVITLFELSKLTTIWENKEVDEVENSKIAEALEEMDEFLGSDYEQQTGDLRHSMTKEAMEKMDCSEFTARFLQKVCDLEEVPHPFYTGKIFNSIEEGNLDEYLEYVEGSKELEFKDIKPGYVFLWSRSEYDGHVGVVISYDAVKDKVLVIEAIGSSGARSPEERNCVSDGYCTCKGCVRKYSYSRTGNALAKHAGWEGYFKPKTKD